MIINHGLQSRTVKLVDTSNKKMLDCMTTPGGGALPHMGNIGMCSPKGYGFSAVLIINVVSMLADFGHLGDKKGMVLHSSIMNRPLFHYYRKEKQTKPVTNYVYGNFTLV